MCTCRVPRLQPTLTTRLPIHVGTTTLLHLFKPILPSHTMRSSAEWNTFPLEVWLCILDHSSVGVHKAMSQLSSAFNEVTKKRLYHTLILGDKAPLGIAKDATNDAAWCRDLHLFYKLHKDRDDWQSLVRRVYLENGDHRDVFPESRTSPLYNSLSEVARNRLIDEYEKLIVDIASLFSDAASMPGTLEFFHTTIPHFQNEYWEEKPPVCGITSLSLPMEDDQGVEFEWLSRIKGIVDNASALRFLEVRDWVWTNSPGLEEFFDNPGTWNLTHMKFTGCGALTEEMEYLLQMPKDLQSLTTTSCFTPGSELHSMADAISIQEAIDVLECVQDTLLELELDPGPSELWVSPEHGVRQFPKPMEPYQSHAVRSFSKLRRLKAPLEVFSQSTGKMTRRDDHTFYTNFPSTLESLTLEVTSRESFNRALEQASFISRGQVALEGKIVDISELACQENCYEKAHELFEELCQLADHKDVLPSLRDVHLLRDPCQWLDCEHVKQCTRQMKQSGITVHVHDRKIEGPITRAEHDGSAGATMLFK
ncbi:hypothetical protein M438DRAFT_6519 [Aureobasidium pullulans EXF-150]|uniref:Uncharacterized protein n=1 Tax=Aureobasidium pullulans EXF-150 TaxID=1043002 RepID=A0A074YRE5_AURPU|nr:uncharacterized protein M438DRAFT_6519 [Aureobasidium pullulans EXF-150]KEQ89436.1 hypothetical protein M438DRAFT_6519 [Aureobasidium pullulans EXF-150]